MCQRVSVSPLLQFLEQQKAGLGSPMLQLPATIVRRLEGKVSPTLSLPPPPPTACWLQSQGVACWVCVAWDSLPSLAPTS